jgi:hypothetical protein
MIIPHVKNKWSKLKTVLLGTCHPPEFFKNIPVTKIQDPLKRIAEETIKDLDNFESVLKDFGCTVIRTPTEYGHIFDYGGEVPRSAMQPRDAQLVIDDKLVFTTVDNEGIKNTIEKIVHPDHILYHPTVNDRSRWGVSPIMAAFLTAVDDEVFVDLKEVSPKDVEWFKQQFPNKKFREVSIGGHNDGTFHTIKPGVIISLYDIQNYNKTFPGWDVCYLKGESWPKVAEVSQMKRKTQGRWYVSGEGANDDFIKFVDTWLNDWVGYVEETVFDVNVLVLDEHHVCVSNNKNKKINAFLKKHNMEPVYIPWRHRYFWDGGLHCITLDLERE